MKVKLYRSATIGLDLGQFKLLMDPWLTDGEYYGSWSHFPYFDFSKNLNELNSYDAIYISHIHPDHCSDETLEKINKNIPIYIHSYHAKFLKFKLERLGFKVIELENNKRTEIGRNAYLNIISADNCNPELCYQFFGCADLSVKGPHSQGIDTLSVVDNGTNVLVNVNDCPIELAASTFEDIKKQYEKINILLTGYGGAGPYPQCLENLSISEKISAAISKQNQFLNQAVKYINALNPDYYLPFAGTYTLTGKLSALQNLRGVPSLDYAYNFFENYYEDKNLSQKIKPIKLNFEATFDLDTSECNMPYKKLNMREYNNYVSKNLKNKLLKYEIDEVPNFDEIYELSKKAYQRYCDYNVINSVKPEADIFVKVNGKSLMLSKTQNLSVVCTDEIDKLSKKYVTFETDIRLLKKLLAGPKYAHWNTAQIGSHIKFFRKPDLFERNIYRSMIYFHC